LSGLVIGYAALRFDDDFIANGGFLIRMLQSKNVHAKGVYSVF